MADSRLALICNSMVDRLKTITTANGYRTNVKNVFYDEIPMGLNLDDYQLPAIMVITGKSELQYQQQWLLSRTLIEMQLIHLATVGDTDMINFVGDVARAVHADSATIKRNDAFRTFDGKPTSVKMVEVDTDLNMIDANRFYCVTWEVEYHAHPTDI